MNGKLALIGFLLWSAVAYADPSGKKWFTTGAVPYKVFAHSSIKGVADFSGKVLPAVQSGFTRWSAPTCTRWQISYQGTFSSPTGLSAIANDGQNRVIWLGGTQWQHGSQTLGLTGTMYYTDTGQIIDGDLELNNDVTWKVGGGGSQQVDVESIITHEAGHFLGLDHSAPTTAVMYAYYDSYSGEIKRNLTTKDIDDVCTVYPASTAGGSQGDPCTQDSQCAAAAPACRGAVGSTSKICTRTCTSTTNCPTGYTCQSATPSGMACLPPVGAVDLCKFCTSGSDCSTGLCVTTGQQNWCTRTCLYASDCGPGYDCIQGTTSKICMPNNGVCPSPQCTTASQCAVGYACQGGMCTATGNPGDRCEVSLYCAACSTCILEPNETEAICRACCGGGSGTGSCQGCSTSNCQAGYACYGVTSSTDQICYPHQGVSACEACDAVTPCVSGYTCEGGRCRSPCNPSNPGSCNACFASGTGGYCACPGEVAYTGQACGQLATGTKICTTGNVCVGTPKTCRAKCNLTDPNSCPAGQACQVQDGQGVCIATNEEGQRCSACHANGTCGTGMVCVSGRCYEPCQPGFASCNSCVEAAVGVGICACDDQLSGPGQGCGMIAGDVYACAQGAVCVDGICRLQCTNNAQCGPGQVCSASGNCVQAPPADGGTTDAGSTDAGNTDGGAKDGGNNPWLPPSTPDAGTPGNKQDAGCGCAAGAGGSGLVWALLGLGGVWARRRRRVVA